MKGRKIFKKLIEPSEVMNVLLKMTKKTFLNEVLSESIEMKIEEAVGRLLAENVYSPADLPYYPRSLVDGCAVKSSDTAHAGESTPIELKYKGLVHVGDNPKDKVTEGSCIEVDTGAWIPVGADSVVPIEYVELRGDTAILSKSSGIGMNIALPSTDIGKGDMIASKGTLVTPELVSSIASVGLDVVKTSRPLYVSIGSTGDELIEPGKPLEEGKIYNSNRSYLVSRIRQLGMNVIDYGIIPDNLNELEAHLSDAMKKSDIVIFTGGTSAGPEDVLYKAVERVGKILVHGLKIKPGKPTIIGLLGDKPFFGLPGNPRSALNVFEEVVERYLYKMGLMVKPGFIINTYELPVNIFGTRGRRTYIPISVDNTYLWPVARDSYMIASYAWADGYIEISADAYAPLTKGEKVSAVLHKNPVGTIYSLTDIGDLSKYSSIIEGYIASEPYKVIPVPRDQIDEKIIGNLEHLIATNLVMDTGNNTGSRLYRRLYSRHLVRIERSSRCEYTGIRSGYGFLAKQVDGAVLYHPRFQGLLILFRKGYMDCAIVPSDLLEENKDLLGYTTDIIAKENVFLSSKPHTE
ncbi:MAG: molybdopterin molybdotransferase MoeA [Desulfurococcales archaeon]|nr:molybdopterin molybdotransferase MoeA [Desulfurococcales archaeon]